MAFIYKRPPRPFHRGYASPEQPPSPSPKARPTEHGNRENLTNNATLSSIATNRTKRGPSKHRSPGGGIDIALLALSEEVKSWAKFYRDFYQEFEHQVSGLKDWAQDSTLDTLWKDRVSAKLRGKAESERLRSMADRVLNCRETVKEAIENKGGGRRSTQEAKYKIEHQVHTAKKALVYCEVLGELIDRAPEERAVCKHLVTELEEARSLLNRKRHPWIYGRSGHEKQISETDNSSTGKHRSESKPLPKTPSESEVTDVNDDRKSEKPEGEPDSFEDVVEVAREGADDTW
ncbi:hypothetical protein OQA88_3942 [Cercophora sp. LCS_1]